MLIGVGNTYRCDDGVGIIVAQRIRERLPALRVVESSGEGMQLMNLWQSADVVAIVDAVRSGSSPGRVHRLDARTERVPSDFFHYSTHAFGVAEAIELSRAMGTLPSLTVYGIEGKNFAAGCELSPDVAASVENVADRILAEFDAATHPAVESRGISHA